MAIDYDKLIYYSGANSFKNIGVYTTSITTPNSLNAGQTLNNDSVVTLSENQNFAYAIAYYTNVVTNVTSWQVVPTANGKMDVLTAPFVGSTNYIIYFILNGPQITFRVTLVNPYAAPINITPITVDFRYVTYTTLY